LVAFAPFGPGFRNGSATGKRSIFPQAKF
jgi:hypothetical protein